MSSPLLRLPLELRLDIYDLALQHETEVTIATVLDTSYKAPIPGIPQGHRPIIVPGFDEELLSFTKFAPQQWKSKRAAMIVRNNNRVLESRKMSALAGQLSGRRPLIIADGVVVDALRPSLSRNSSFESSASVTSPLSTAPPTPAENEQSGYGALLFSCRQIRAELTTHLAVRWKEPLRIHVSYPFGALALANMYHPLIAATRSINMCGFHAPLSHTLKEEDLVGTAHHFNMEDWLTLDGSRGIQNEFGPEPPTISYITDELARHTLRDLLYDVLNPKNFRHFESFTLRMFSPSHRDWRHSITMNDTEWDEMIKVQNELEAEDGAELKQRRFERRHFEEEESKDEESEGEYEERPFEDAQFEQEEIEVRKARVPLETDSWMWKGKGGAAYVKRLARRPTEAIGYCRDTVEWPSFQSPGAEDWMGIITGARDWKCPIME
jgi:hypothetical protein